MNLPSLNISGNVLSDLFFNADKPNYIAHCHRYQDYAGNEPATRAAIMQDANEFAVMIGRPDLAADLVEDFFSRL